MSTYIVLSDGTRLERPRDLEGADQATIEAWETAAHAAPLPQPIVTPTAEAAHVQLEA